MQVIVTQSDLEQIEALIEDFLTSFHPDIDFSRGSALNDILVQGLKVPLSLISSMAERFRQTRSVAGIERILAGIEAGDPTDPDIISAKAEVESALTEVLSNWFSTRRTGSRARGLINIHLSANVGFTLVNDWRVYRTSGLPFTPVTNTDIAVTAADLQTITDGNGIVLEYIYRTMVESLVEGDIGNVEPGEWEAFDNINPFITKVTSDFTFSRGADPETASEYLSRVAEEEVSERTLDNQRAITATLTRDFPEFLPARVIRAGDPEMQRDLVKLGGSFKIHQLGHWNVYVGGDVLESQLLTANLNTPSTHPRTGEDLPALSSRLLLPNNPILFIREIRWKGSTTNDALAPYVDSDGYVRFELLSRYSLDTSGKRIETPYLAPNQAKLIPVDDESPMYWGTKKQAMWLEINPTAFVNVSPQIEVVYDTVANFDTLHTYFESERPGAGSPLLYAYYPAVLSFDLEYIKRADINQSLSVNVEEAKRELTTFVRGQKEGNPLFASAISREFTLLYGDIAAGVKPLTLKYHVWLPDGSRLDFETTDRVSFNLNYLTSSSYIPKDENNVALDLLSMQLSDRTMQVYADEVNINVISST